MMWYREAERGTRVVRFDGPCMGDLGARTVPATGKSIIHQPPQNNELPPQLGSSRFAQLALGYTNPISYSVSIQERDTGV